MSLRQRLERLAGNRGAAGLTGAPVPRPAPALEALCREAAETLGGAVYETPHGPTVVLASGEVPPGGLPGAVPALLAALDLSTSADDGEAGDLVYLDVETTGLAGGTGTRAFVAGVGRAGPAGASLRQFVLVDPAVEAGFLWAVREELRTAGTLVTFNGRTFDWPLLEARFVLSRLTLPRPGAHLDLLHPARRLWGFRLGSCSLGALEAQVLGQVREDDVPAAVIPLLYLDFLRHRDPGALRPVLEHNRRDVTALAALAYRLERCLAAPHLALEHATEWLGLGRLHWSRGRRAEALHCFERAVAAAGTRREWEVCARAAARAARRTGHLDRARELWWRLVADPDPGSLEPHVELAKDLEHRQKQPERARDVVARALALARRREAAGVAPGREVSVAALDHRLRRLQRKLARRALRAGCRLTGPDTA